MSASPPTDLANQIDSDRLPLGATWHERNECSFLVWAPRAKRMEVHLLGSQERMIAMQPGGCGYFSAIADGVSPGDLYQYRIDGQKERPDPASRFQLQGVHGPSQVVDPRFEWADASWKGLTNEKLVLYELHVGAFTSQGTLEAIIERIPRLKELGITAIELMPIAQFPGRRNWGYDGVYLYAVQNSYGTPQSLKKLVDTCHRHGMGVFLDVVYNHFGPEGNYTADYGPYVTDYYKTPWGDALNFDRAQSDQVRRYFIENALYWITEFHIDGLRLDAIHAIVDPSARPFLEELGQVCHEKAKELGRHVLVIAESNLNKPRVVEKRSLGGWGFDAQWNDDFHHSLHVLLTGEQSGYLGDFHGIEDLYRAYRDGFVYEGQYSEFRQKRHGRSSKNIPAEKFVVFGQNHDQIGNRPLSDRLSQIVNFEQLKLSAGVVLLSPYVPLLFMGEEYGDPAPFPYFVDHGDPTLTEAVRKGRVKEFESYHYDAEFLDPSTEETFQRSKLDWSLQREGRHKIVREFYRRLLQLRCDVPALGRLDKQSMEVELLDDFKILAVTRWYEQSRVCVIHHFGDAPRQFEPPLEPGIWRKLLDSSDSRWSADDRATASSAPRASSVQYESERFSVDAAAQIMLKPFSFVVFEREP
jgi:maltooligosyltrehalose trehalohydrolase